LLAPLTIWVSATAAGPLGRGILASASAAIAGGVLLTVSAGPTLCLLLGSAFALATLGRRGLPPVLALLLTAAGFALALPFSAQVREAMGSWVGLESSVSTQTRMRLAYRLGACCLS
jgi:hypothetical protein